MQTLCRRLCSKLPALVWGLGSSLLSFAGEPGTPLRFLGNAELPPMVWNYHGTTQGVAVDLVNAAAHKVGLSISIVGADWKIAQDELRDGKVDALIQINKTPQRLEIYDFSDPLLQSNFHIFRRTKDVDISGIDSLSGRKVGVEAGGFPIEFLKKYDQIGVVVVPNWSKALEKLSAGEIDAVFVDRWVGEYELYQRKFNNITLIDPPVVTLESSIAVKKGNTALLVKINEGLRRIERDGTRQSILRKWEAKEVVYLTRESIDRIIMAVVAAAALFMLGVIAYLYRQRKSLESANSALEFANERLSQLATTDTLTGIWNRRSFEERVGHELIKADRYKQPLSVLIFDIDQFKLVNDSYGHLVGDRVLVELCDMARQQTRDSDLLARWGGEEFIMLMPNTGLNEAMAVAEKLRANFASHNFQDAGSITASFGVALYQPGESVDHWISRADAALYEAKQEGRNKVKIAHGR